ncbi:MAG: hypothetical protein QOK37_3809 [Thermoanaerobaculia bacterium]|jgi:hypothetical protein|nr:hypothetical protein [Thermoanaerobaculia bacterium]
MRATNRFFMPLACAIVLFVALTAQGQTPAAPAPPEAPSFKIGATIFADYTFLSAPVSRDSDGNRIHPASFNVSRAYVNMNGQLNRSITFRITPDITREGGSGSSLNGSQMFRLKYAFAQLSLDDLVSKGSWIRLGVQQTPLLDFAEGIYRYRFQGTMFVEREGYLTSSDAGLSAHYNFAGNYGDVHAGVYNGEGYSKAETNDQKAIQVRATVRPLPGSTNGKGLRITVFYDGDNFVKGAARQRFIEQATFEHARFSAGFDHINTKDQTSAAARSITGNGWSVWLNPRLHNGWEILLRHDEMHPDQATQQIRRRNIAGLAYWIPNLQKATSSILIDYDSLQQQNYGPARPNETRFGLKMLLQF